MNSFMQALAATEAFSRELLSVAPPAGASRFFVMLQSTIAHMRLSQQAVYRPSDLLRSLPTQFAGGRQHDAFEFGKAAIDSIENIVKVAADAFTGELQVLVTCSGCGKTSSRAESMQDLVLPLATSESSTSVEALMGQHFAAEPLEGNNQYRCEPCGVLRDAQRVVQVTTPPDNLIVGLNRFRWDPKTNSSPKVHTKVAVAREVVLPCAKPYANPNGTEAESLNDEVSEACENHNAVYELYAMVVHSGPSAQSGHYYCYAKTSKTQESPWCLFNDHSVSQSSFEVHPLDGFCVVLTICFLSGNAIEFSKLRDTLCIVL
jgi:ubiquitin C-terminal hydrolase